MGSLVGGVSLTLLSRSDEREQPTGLDFNAEGFPKKLIRLFCFMFSEEDRFSGTFCNGMVDVERDDWTRYFVLSIQSRRRGALWHICAVQI